MKKIIIVLFVFAIASSYGQENEFNKKHDLLLNFGLSHSSNWKNKYVPPDERYWYTNQVTPLPPYTLAPSFYYFTGITYRYNFRNFFSLDFSVNYSLIPRVEEYNVDSLNKYHILPDSLNVEFPVKKKTFENYFETGISFGYCYKRFSASLGLYYTILSFYKFNSFYLHKESIKNYYSLYFDYWYPSLQINYMLFKLKYPLFLYFKMGDSFIFGMKIQIK